MSVKQQIINEIHRPARINFHRRRIVIKGLDDLLQADLVEMIPYARENRGYRYILVVINAFSKFVWAVPVKRKAGEDISSALDALLQHMKPQPHNLQTDLGKEFYNRHVQQVLQKYNINHYSVYSNKKAAIVERVNRTLKSKMWKRFSFQGSYKWIQLLPEIVKDYNNTIHRTTNMKPGDVQQRHVSSLLQTVYSNPKKVNLRAQKFKEGDFVRISKHREQFAKGYTPNWSSEIFQIRKVHLTDPITYLLRDSSGEDILGGFYVEELQPVKFPDVYLVQKVLRRKKNMVLVRWLGLDPKHDSWIHKSNVVL